MMNKIILESEITIGEIVIPCYILEDGSRILSTTGMQKALGVVENEPKQRSSKRLEEITTSRAVSPFMSSDLIASKLLPKKCHLGNRVINGYDAMALPEFCEGLMRCFSRNTTNSLCSFY